MSGLPPWARKGALVVCRDAGPRRDADVGAPSPLGLTEGSIYTLRDVASRLDGKNGCRLVEFGPTNYGFLLDRFRPLVDDANDSEVEAELFRKRIHQNAAPRKVSERA